MKQLKAVLEVIKTILLFVGLTAITQIGGLIYLLYKPIGNSLKNKFSKTKGLMIRLSVFAALYLLFSLAVIPYLAGKFGRVPLPTSKQSKLIPANYFIHIANRHYVKPEMKELLLETADQLPEGVAIVYLDANFPFIDGFPLLGHLSHNDGEKVDLAFIYSNPGGTYLNKAKSLSGYGIVEKPKESETNQSQICEQQGFWQYSITSDLTFYEKYKEFKFDNAANRGLLKELAINPKTGKIFIEPHLENRLRLTKYAKVRFHGCHAARHDDHIHLQL